VKRLSDEERLLVQLVHLLSYGDKLEFGLTLSEVLDYLEKPIPRKGNKNAMECLKLEGDKFLKDLQDYLSEKA
jgi:hypothetical protein